jgi:hypothetical protein
MHVAVKTLNVSMMVPDGVTTDEQLAKVIAFINSEEIVQSLLAARGVNFCVGGPAPEKSAESPRDALKRVRGELMDWMASKRLNQTQAADKLKVVTNATLSRIIAGDPRVMYGTLEKVSEALKGLDLCTSSR